MDFGGAGFIMLAKALKTRGADVHWFSFGPQVERLQAAGCDATPAPDVLRLILRPFSPDRETTEFSERHQARINGLQRLRGKIEAFTPDFILFDRLLAFGGLLAEEIGVPYAAIGTPGGAWRFFERTPKGVDIHPARDGVDEYRRYAAALHADLGWRGNAEVESGWLSSPVLNLHFLPQDFYASPNASDAASVFHHHPHQENLSNGRLGVSFGNQGDPAALLTLLRHTVDQKLAPFPIEVFAGTNDVLKRELRAAYSSDEVTVHDWVDFDAHFARLDRLAFLGGVGTIWRCLDHQVAMLITPGHVGDQLENARRVDALGLGVCVEPAKVTADTVADALSKLENDTFRTRLKKAGSPARYSDTMESVSGRILQLAGAS